MPNRYRATHESPPKPKGEGWLVNGVEQLLVRFSNDPNRSWPVGHPEHLPLGETPSTGPAKPEAHAQAQRRGSLENHANGRLASMRSTGALIC